MGGMTLERVIVSMGTRFYRLEKCAVERYIYTVLIGNVKQVTRDVIDFSEPSSVHILQH
jgi:hypothetical protein